jgi:hypothetical protein
MKFIFGYAGIPIEALDGVKARQSQLFAAPDEAIFGDPIKGGDAYPVTYAKVLMERFVERIAKDHHDALHDTAFGVIYVDHPGESTARFVQAMFPAMLCAPLDWRLNRATNATMRTSRNQLLELLKTATKKTRLALIELRGAMQNPGHTPLLLPTRNFESDALVTTLRELQAEIISATDKAERIRAAVHRLEQRHPPAAPRRFFIDDRNIEFRPPGSVRGRHGFIRPDEKHPPICILAGRRRMGAPFDKQFHYDCQRGEKLTGHFFGCHSDPSHQVGDPH